MKDFTHLKKAVFAFALMFSFSSLFAQTYTLTDDDVIVEGGVITSCSYSFALTDIIIPQTLDGQTVIGITDGWYSSSGVFNDKGITSVELPTTINRIGAYAFYNNDVASLDLSGYTGLDTIGSYAFYDNELASLNLSGCTALLAIENQAFGSNNMLVSLDLTDCSGLISIGEDAFNNGDISSLDFSDCTSLTSIGETAFSYNALTTLDLSPCTALASIGESSFASNNIATLNLNGCEGLRKIGEWAFGGNTITEFDLPEVTYEGSVYNSWIDVESNMYTAGVDQATNFSTFYVPYIPYTLTDDDVVVEEGVIISCSYDFELKNIIIPQTLDGQTVIAIADGWHSGSGVFNNKGITSLVLPTTINRIGAYAFYNNDVASIDLSGYTGLDTIGSYAFYDNELASLNLSGCIALLAIENQAFGSNNRLISLDLTDCSGLISIGEDAFNNGDISSLDLSDCTSLTSIGETAFSYNALTTLDLSPCTALASIGGSSFASNLIATLSLNGCEGLRIIGYGAFGGNTITEFDLPEVTYEGTVYNSWIDGESNTYTAGVDPATNFYTFYVPSIPYTLTDDDVVVEEGVIISCSYDFELKNIIIPQTLDGQTVIGITDGWHSGSGVFNDKGITSVELPTTINRIGAYAFYNNDVASLDLSGYTGLDTIGSYAFYDNELASLNLSGCTALLAIEYQSFGSNNMLVSLDLTDCSGLISIGEDAFNNGDISSLDLSDCTSLTSIGETAFSYNALTTLDLSPCTALASIGESSFASNNIATLNLNGCEGLRKIGEWAFGGNTITEFDLPEVTYEGTLYNSWIDVESNMYTAGVDQATNFSTFYVPYIPYSLTDDDVVVEEGVIISCSYDFELKNIIIPQTLDGQTVIAIADGWHSNSGVFCNKGITSLELPTTIHRIGAYAFYNNDVASLDLSGYTGLDNIGSYAFYDNELASLNLSGCIALLAIENYAFESNNNLISLDLTDCSGLISIGEDAFNNGDIASLDLSDCTSLTSIGETAFSYNALTALDLSPCTALVSIGESSFASNLIATLNLNGCEGLRIIGSGAFGGNPITEFDLPEVTYEGTVYNSWIDGESNTYTAGVDPATDFYTIYVPYIPYTLTDGDVELVGGIIISCSYDFELKNIIIPQTLDGQTVTGITDGWYSGAGLFNNKSIVTLGLPASIRDIGSYAFSDNEINELDLSLCPDIARIGDYAFSGNSIEALDLDGSTSLIEIGNYAFYYNSLSGFNLPDPVIPDYFYSNWEDSDGGMHSGGDHVSNLRLSYSRLMPEITAIDPVYASTSGNLEISFKGSNFESDRNNKTVLFEGVEAASYTFWNDTMITAVCPPNPEGSAKIEMTLENNLSYHSMKQFYYSDEDIVTVCGIVSGIWERGKTYLLTCNVNIPDDSTLIVEQGVRILAMPGEQIEFRIDGTIEVEGTEAEPVTFSSTTELPGSWEGIKIYGTYSRCTFKYCVIESARTAVYLVGWAYGCDSEANSSIFENCIVRNNTNEGFYCRGAGSSSTGCTWPHTGVCSPTINSCQIYNNGGEGIKLYAYDGYFSNGYIGAKIYNNLIYSNKNGIYSSGSDWVEPEITNNVIAENSIAGINSTHGYFNWDDYIIANNIIMDNGTGVINEDTSTVVLYNNAFWTNAVDLQGELADSSNIYLDPMFVDAGNQDYNLTTGSPCIDAGDNNFAASDYDYYDKKRIWDGNNDQDSIVDMGIAEFGAPCYFTNETISICEGDSVQVGESVFTETGIYTVELSDQFGCDSIVHLDLTVISVNTGVSQSGDTLTAEAIDAEYRWLDCENNYTFISGATFQSYVANVDGNYSVEVSFGGCRDTSDCYLVDVVETAVPGINDFGSSFLVYPNPTDQYVSIELGATYEDVRLRVFNAAGRQISDLEYGAADIIHYELEDDPGHYIFRINTKEGKSASFNIVKN